NVPAATRAGRIRVRAGAGRAAGPGLLALDAQCTATRGHRERRPGAGTTAAGGAAATDTRSADWSRATLPGARRAGCAFGGTHGDESWTTIARSGLGSGQAG